MKKVKSRQLISRRVRLGNAAFLIAILMNLIMPAGWLERSLAGPGNGAGSGGGGATGGGGEPHGPQQPPQDIGAGFEPGPLDGDFIARTWVETHERLFGRAPEGFQTAFYLISNDLFEGVGEYDGVKSMGEPLTIEVIRFHDYGEVPAPPEGPVDGEPADDDLPPAAGTLGGRHGLVWATLATELGAANVIGLYIAAAPSVAARGGSGGVETPVHGLMPLIDHDVLFADIAAGDPEDPNDDFTFGMMAEGDEGPCGKKHTQICLTCPNGTIWCPCNDPVVQAAQGNLRACLIFATTVLAAAMTGISLALRTATLACLAQPPIIQFECHAAAHAASTVATRQAMLLYVLAMEACFTDYFTIRNAAAAAACRLSP